MTLCGELQESSFEVAAQRMQDLLDKDADDLLTPADSTEIETLTSEADRLMLRKAHSAALLHWRGHTLPPADKLWQLMSAYLSASLRKKLIETDDHRCACCRQPKQLPVSNGC